MKEPDWSHIRSFLAVYDEGSLSGAARRLGLTQPTLGRQIAELEKDLGVALFIRSQRGLTPTDAANDIARHAQAMSAASSAMIRAASGGESDIAGTIRITASDIIGAEVLPPLLALFRSIAPRVTIELSLSNRVADLLTGEADIAVRMLRPGQQAIVARHVGDVGLGLYAHRHYLEAAPKLTTPRAMLGEHTLIGFDRETPVLPDLSENLTLVRDIFSLRTDNDLAQLAAIRAGCGIGLIQHGIARRSKELVPVFPDQISARLEIWLALHEDLRTSRRLRLMMDHLLAGLMDYVNQSQPSRG
ncbi:MAG TPA: LysR family transcriptional regulator [Bradyrhizobium sp.]|jgi:DNA-binding transcriptional LysR family regulator|nr:LysR family transcriptional regulator [Bradyrhizobium sp.]